MDNIKEYIEKYVTFGKSIPYHGLKIKPVLVKDFYQFQNAQNVLKIDKNKIPDVNIIQMTYLRFLTLMVCENAEMLEDFLTILALCLGLRYDEKMRDTKFNPNEILAQQIKKSVSQLSVNGWGIRFVVTETRVLLQLYINGVWLEFNDEQFDDIKKIILFQNIHDYDDMEMSEDFRRVVEEYYALKNKDVVLPTLEDRMMAVVVSSSYKLEELYKIPLRLFDSLFEYSVNKLEYQVNKLIVNLAHGEVKGFSLSHWVYIRKSVQLGGADHVRILFIIRQMPARHL